MKHVNKLRRYEQKGKFRTDCDAYFNGEVLVTLNCFLDFPQHENFSISYVMSYYQSEFVCKRPSKQNVRTSDEL